MIATNERVRGSRRPPDPLVVKKHHSEVKRALHSHIREHRATAQRIEFRQLVSELAEAAVVLSTHLVEDVAVLADQVLVLDHGRERFRGTVAELKERAAPDAPGDSVLERAYMSVLADDPDQRGHSHG